MCPVAEECLSFKLCSAPYSVPSVLALVCLVSLVTLSTHTPSPFPRRRARQYLELGPVLSDSEHNEPLSPDVFHKYFVDIVQGLEYLQFQGIVHRCVVGVARQRPLHLMPLSSLSPRDSQTRSTPCPCAVVTA